MNHHTLKTHGDYATPSTPFAQLSWPARLRAAWDIFRLQSQLLFSHRLFWFLFGVAAWLVFLYIINYRQPLLSRLQTDAVFTLVLELPLGVLAILLSMQIIASEKEKRTLEVMFTAAGSRYKLWLLRFGSLHLLLALLAVVLNLFAFFFFTDIPLFTAALHAFIPAFFISTLTLFFSVRLRSGLAAGMITAGLSSVLLLFSAELSDTAYTVFFNPYAVFRHVDPEVRTLWMWQNRISITIAGLLFYFGALRGLDKRERLLK